MALSRALPEDDDLGAVSSGIRRRSLSIVRRTRLINVRQLFAASIAGWSRESCARSIVDAATEETAAASAPRMLMLDVV